MNTPLNVPAWLIVVTILFFSGIAWGFGYANGVTEYKPPQECVDTRSLVEKQMDLQREIEKAEEKRGEKRRKILCHCIW